MIKVAIVGNIASGKTEFEKYLFKNDYVVFDTDVMAHDILIDKPEIAKAFVDYDVFEHGRLSREKLGKLVFDNEELKTKLEDLVHPMILDDIERIFKTYEDEKFVFISVPLLFEVGWEKFFDKIIFIKSDEDIRLNRLMQRNGYTKEYAQKRINSQMKQDEKIKKADFVVENNSTKEEFYRNIANCLTQL